MAGSELVAEVLGEHVFDFFLRNKRAEWEEYRREVTPYERQRYLTLLARVPLRAGRPASAASGRA